MTFYLPWERYLSVILENSYGGKQAEYMELLVMSENFTDIPFPLSNLYLGVCDKENI